MNEQSTYFISDAHLGLSLRGGEGRQEALSSFLAEISSRARRLVIGGDFFDFWIEYRRAIRPDYFSILHRLRTLVEAGVEVHFCAGNHDFGAGRFLREEMGFQVYPRQASFAISGLRIRVEHGDGLLKKDYAGRFFRRVLQRPFFQGAYRFLHPNLGVALAQGLSGLSRKRGIFSTTPEQLAEYRDIARRRLQEGCDIVFLGHTHIPELVRFPEGIYCNTGGWLGSYSFALLQEDGQLSLWRYHPGKEPERLCGDQDPPLSISFFS